VIILSSTSVVRRQLLTQAGLQIKTARPPVEEGRLKETMRKAGASAAQVAEALAECKAASIGEILPGAFVIGADQMLVCDDVWFDKPVDRAAAKQQLQSLRGRTHALITAAVIVAEGKILWKFTDSARLTMREFSDEFLDAYLDSVGDAATRAVGGYQLEGLGVQLFETIDGDYFSILGLPLLPLLAALRQAGAVPT